MVYWYESAEEEQTLSKVIVYSFWILLVILGVVNYIMAYWYYWYKGAIGMSDSDLESKLVLSNAVAEGDEEKVKYLLQVNRPNEITTWGCANALALACKAEMLGIARLLVTNKRFPADPNQPYYQYALAEIPFNVAVRSGNKELVKLLLEESLVPVKLNSVYDRTTTSLLLAVENDDAPIVEILLEAGVNPDVTPPEGYSTLYKALEECGSDITKMLLEHTRNINALLYVTTPRQVDSAFSLMSALGMLDAVKFVLERGADIFSNHDDEVFEGAFANDQFEMIELFLQHTYGMVGDHLHELWIEDSFHWALEAQAKGCLNVLFSWGVYSFSKSSDYYPFRTVFHMAARSGNIQAVKMLSELDPQCLQERWMVQGDFLSLSRWSSEGLELLADLTERRKQPSTLVLLCRTIIIDCLGCRPLLKVQKLPLPRQIKNYISSVFTRNIEVGESHGFLQ